MTKVKEIAKAIASLPEADYTRFRQWFFKRDWERWDREIEEDAKTGKLSFLQREAFDAKVKGQLRAL